MSRAGKIVIILVVCFLVIVGSVVAMGVYWWTHHSRELMESTQKVYKEGQDAGRKTDEQGCLNAAIARYKENTGFTGSISTSLFLRSCLDESRPTPGFCDGVPRRLEILRSAQWQIEQAKKAGINDNFGRQLFTQVQEYCETKGAKKSAPSGVPAGVAR